MFAVTGTGFSAAKRLTNDGKVRTPKTRLETASRLTLAPRAHSRPDTPSTSGRTA